MHNNDGPSTQNNSQQIAAASEWRLRLISALDVTRWAAKPPSMSTIHNSSAQAVKTRVAAISVFASAAMAAAKFVVGIAIGSLALISEALHSTVDVVATIITWLVWQHRVTANVWARGHPVATRPGWAVGWWFIPVVDLWMPAVALARTTGHRPGNPPGAQRQGGTSERVQRPARA